MNYHPKLNIHRIPKEAYDPNLTAQPHEHKPSKNNALLITVTQQAIAAGALIYAGYSIDNGTDALTTVQQATKQTLILTGALNASRSILWAMAHDGVKKWSKIATLRSQFSLASMMVNKSFAELRGDHETALSLESQITCKQHDINKKQADIEKYGFKYQDRNIAHTKVNIAGTVLGAACYIPMTLHGGHDFIHALISPDIPLNAGAFSTLLNGEFIGGGATMLAYIGWSKRFSDEHHHLQGQFKKYAHQERAPEPDTANTYDPNMGIPCYTYRERAESHCHKPDFKSKVKTLKLRTKDVLLEWTPLVLFIAKGAAFISEGGAAMITSGTFFGLSGVNEIKHEKGDIIKSAWHRAQKNLYGSKAPFTDDIARAMHATDLSIDAINHSTQKIGRYIKKQAHTILRTKDKDGLDLCP